MNESKPTVSILVVSYNVRELLAACLRSVQQKTTGIAYEVIVVDSNSNDGTVEFLRAHFSWVNVIPCNENVGFPKGNNIAYDASHGEFIFMLNPDTELTTNVVKQLHDFLTLHGNAGLVGPKMLNTDGSLQRSAQPFITEDEIIAEVFYLHQMLWKQRSYFKHEITAPLEVEALSGAAMMCKRSLIKQIGFLDDNLFWTEDMDFCFRAHQAGFKNFYLPDAVLTHHVGQSGKKNQAVMISRQLLTKINFFKKHRGKFSTSVVATARFAHIVSRLMMFAAAYPFGERFRDKFKAYRFTLNSFLNRRY